MSELSHRRLLEGCALSILPLLFPSVSAPTRGAGHGFGDDLYLETMRWMKEQLGSAHAAQPEPSDDESR
jgi:hypothetical protein